MTLPYCSVHGSRVRYKWHDEERRDCPKGGTPVWLTEGEWAEMFPELAERRVRDLEDHTAFIQERTAVGTTVLPRTNRLAEGGQDEHYIRLVMDEIRGGAA